MLRCISVGEMSMGTLLKILWLGREIKSTEISQLSSSALHSGKQTKAESDGEHQSHKWDKVCDYLITASSIAKIRGRK